MNRNEHSFSPTSMGKIIGSYMVIFLVFIAPLRSDNPPDFLNPPPVLTCDRVTSNLRVLYDFTEGSSSTVNDVSGVGNPLNLHIQNTGNTSWQSGCGLKINSNTIIKSSSAASKIINGVKNTNAITVEAWVKPNNTSQDGPARIVTISKDNDVRNVTLGQDDHNYITRLRTTHTNHQGHPTVETSGGVATQIQHVVYTRNAAGHERIYVDGVVKYSGTRDGDFSSWDGTYKLGIGNELNNERPWIGTVYLVAVYNKALSQSEVNQNFNAGECCNGEGSNNAEPSFSGNIFNDCGNNTSVEVIGAGLLSSNSNTVSIPNPFNVKQVLAELYYEGDEGGCNGVPSSVTMTASNGQTKTVQGIQLTSNSTTTPAEEDTFYRALFTGPISSVSFPSISGCKPVSLVLYIFREMAGVTSSVATIDASIYKGSFSKTISIGTSATSRDIHLQIPVSEMDQDGRVAILSASAGGVSNSVTINKNTFGDRLNIVNLTLKNVPGTANNLTFTANSPNTNGDSFTVGLSANATCTSNTARIGNLVYKDNNEDGFFNAGDGRIEGATVKLLNAAGNVLQTKTTNVNGNYAFTNLSPGNYKVMFNTPADCLPALKTGNASSGINNDNDNDPVTGMTDIIVLGDGEINNTIDAGFKPKSPCDIAGGDSDGDGVCNNDDCKPNNPNFPATPGTACNDGDPNTSNDLVQADGCTCAGTPSTGDPDCETDITITTGNGTITISGLNGAPISQLQVFSSSWGTEFSCAGNCNGTVTINVAEGTYFVFAKYFTASWQPICQKEATITVGGGGVDPCDNVTNGGTIGFGTNCSWTREYCPGTQTAPNVKNCSSPIGGTGNLEIVWLKSTTSCTYPTTTFTQIEQGLDPHWTIVSGATSLAYNPGNITQETCFLRCSRRAGCPNFVESNIVSLGISAGCGGDTGSPDCSNIGISKGVGSITVTGLGAAPIASVQIFNAAWQTEHNCFANCNSPTATFPVAPGTHYVYVKYYSATYQFICELQETVNVTQNLLANNQQLDFEAVKQPEHVELFWFHAGDYLVSEYTVERSVDGIHFAPLLYQSSDRDAAADLYQAFDTEPLVGKNYYRIKYLLDDGTLGYSDIQWVEFADLVDFSLFPNPTSHFTNINLETVRGKAVDLYLCNSLGVLLKTIHLEEVWSKYYQLDVNGLREGLYMIWVHPKNQRPVARQLIIGKP